MVICGGMMRKKAKFFLFSEESKCKKLINKGIAFIYIVLGINAYLLLTLIVLSALRIPVTMPVKLIFGIIVAVAVIVANYRYYELPKGVTLYNDYMQFDVHGVPDSRHREKSNPKVPSQQRFMRKKYSYSMWTIQRHL
jgi:hypothetical protein